MADRAGGGPARRPPVWWVAAVLGNGAHLPLGTLLPSSPSLAYHHKWVHVCRPICTNTDDGRQPFSRVATQTGEGAQPPRELTGVGFPVGKIAGRLASGDQGGAASDWADGRGFR